jgi:hypothetical protein
MTKFGKRGNNDAIELPDLELPVLPEIARRPPVLTMDQYLAWNTRDEFEGATVSTPLEERCDVLFEL